MQKPLPSAVPGSGPIPGSAGTQGNQGTPQVGQSTQSTAPSANPISGSGSSVGATLPSGPGPSVGTIPSSTQQATTIPGVGPSPSSPPPAGGAPPPGGSSPAPLAGSGTSAISAAVPNPGQNLRGWYPRWWLLSAIFCAVLLGILALLLPTICANRSGTLLCQLATWNDQRQELPILCIWLLFLLGWLIAYVFGVSYIEVDRQMRSPIARFLRAISEFETTYMLLYIYALVAFWIIVFMWYFNRLQMAAFAVCSLVIFVGGSCFLYRRRERRDQQRAWLIGAAILAIFCGGIMFWIGPMELPILTAEAIVIVLAILSIVWRGPDPQGQNAIQALAIARANRLTPIAVFLDLIGAPFRRRANRAAARQAQPNPNQPGQTTP